MIPHTHVSLALAAAAVVVVGLEVEQAAAQSVMTKGEWSVSTVGSSTQFNAIGTPSNRFYGVRPNPAPPPATLNNLSVSQVKGVGRATQNFYLAFPDSSQFTLTRRATQTLNLTVQSVVQVPWYFNGSISFFGGGTRDSRGFASYAIGIFNAANVPVFSYGDSRSQVSADGDAAVNLARLRYVTLPAGSYTINSTLDISGTTAWLGGGSTGTGVEVNFGASGDFRGGATVPWAWDATLPGSRAAVRAPNGRAAHGVDGTGVKVGILESGRVHNATDFSGLHPSLVNATNDKLTIPVPQGPTDFNVATTRFRSEHATAVASIIASADADNENAGIAPGAKIVNAVMGAYDPALVGDNRRFKRAFDDLIASGTEIINASLFTDGAPPPGNGTDPNGDATYVNTQVAARPTLLFVKSAGNNGAGAAAGPGVTAPGTAANGLAVGALNRAITRRAAFSASGGAAGLNPFKPDLVAPGDQINAAAAFGGGWTRAFTGEGFDREPGGSRPEVGTISGTSFAAPMVAGAAALLHQYANNHAADHTRDHRVMKAVLMNSAERSVRRFGGGAWAQGLAPAAANTPLIVNRNLDPELGAGMLDVRGALDQFAPGEVRLADDAAGAQTLIDATAPEVFWDQQEVPRFAAALASAPTVDYQVGALTGALRAALVWDTLADGTTVPNVELRLYSEGANANNPAGYDANDTLLAATRSTGLAGAADTRRQNVGLFDFTIENLPIVPGAADELFLSVWNFDVNNLVNFGLAVQLNHVAVIPEPASLSLILMGAWMLRRSRVA